MLIGGGAMNIMQRRLRFARKKCQSKGSSQEESLRRLQTSGILDENGTVTNNYKEYLEKKDTKDGEDE